MKLDAKPKYLGEKQEKKEKVMPRGFIAGPEYFDAISAEMHKVQLETLEDGTKGVSFYIDTSDEFRQACRIIGVNYLESKMLKTEGGSRIHKVTFSVGDPHFNIDWDRNGWRKDEETRKRTESILTVFAQTIGRRVLLDTPHMNHRKESHGPGFRIRIWSSPSGNMTPRPPKTIWGQKCDQSDSPYLPTGDGVPIMDEEHDYCVAELFENDLYVHHDLCHFGRHSELDLFEELLRRVSGLLATNSLPDRETMERLFVSQCLSSHSKYKEVLRREMYNDEKKEVDLKRQLEKIEKRLKERRARLELIRGIKPDEEPLKASFASLWENPMASEVRIKSGVIEVKTPRLYAQDPRTGVIYRIGTQMITIHPNGKNGGVRFVCTEGKKAKKGSANLSGTGRPIPHADKDGFITHPEALAPITELIAFQQFHEVFDLAIQAATTFDPDDKLAADLTKWPLATPNELVGTEWEGMQVEATPEAVA